jgi:signal peptidase II
MQAARGAAVADTQAPPVAAHRRTALLAAVAGLVLVTDIITKLVAVAKLAHRSRVTLVPHVLWLTFTRNAGAAFGVGTGATWIFTAVAVAVVVVILRTARALASAGWAVALGLLLGGALGNLSDRIFRSPGPLRGHVVDWIELPHWPIFNIADASIVVGGVLAVLLASRGIELTDERGRPQEPVAADSGDA